MVLIVDPDSAVAVAEAPWQSPVAVIESEEILAWSPPSSSMAIIKYRQGLGSDSASAPIIFPPIDHENLIVHQTTPLASREIEPILTEGQKVWFSDSVTNSDTDSNSASTFPASDSCTDHCSVRSCAKELRPVFGVSTSRWTEILQSGMAALFRFLNSSFSSSRGIFVTYRSATITATVLAYLYFRRSRRLRAEEGNLDTLAAIIKRREEKINQLLDQLLRLNEVLLALQRISSGNTA